MTKGVEAKFSQNPDLCTILLDTGDIVLAEGSLDKVWGIGSRLDDQKATDRNAWTGANRWRNLDER